jgi:hypothetical protein
MAAVLMLRTSAECGAYAGARTPLSTKRMKSHHRPRCGVSTMAPVDHLTSPGVLNVIGLVFQIIGIGLASNGLWRTWHEYGPDDEAFVAPVNRAFASARRRMITGIDAIRRVLGRPRRQVITGVGASEFGWAMGKARVRVHFRELPTELDVGAAISELDGRTRQLSTTIADTADRLDDDVQAIHSSVGRMDDRVSTAIKGLDRQSRQIAAGGTRLEAVGLFAVAVGTLLQVMAILVS